jgi:hypothetical protein
MKKNISKKVFPQKNYASYASFSFLWMGMISLSLLLLIIFLCIGSVLFFSFSSREKTDFRSCEVPINKKEFTLIQEIPEYSLLYEERIKKYKQEEKEIESYSLEGESEKEGEEESEKENEAPSLFPEVPPEPLP